METKEYYNFWEYCNKFYGIECHAFDQGEALKEEWDMIIDIISSLRKKELDPI